MKPIVIDIDKTFIKFKEFKCIKFLKNQILFVIVVMRNFIKEKDLWKYFAFIYALYFIGYFGLILADVYYIDDLGRSKGGYFGFLDFSRYLSENLSKIIHLNLHHNTDISPITQFIAMMFLSFGSILLVKIISKQLSYFALIGSTPLGLSPFFLQNMSYKFDSPFMSIAIISPIFAFLFFRRNFVFFIISILMILITLNTYQAGNSIYIILSLFFIFKISIQAKQLRYIFNKITICIISYVIGMGIYKFFILKETDDYVSSGIIKENFITEVFKNISKTLNIYKEVLHNSAYEYILYFAIIAFLIATFTQAKINKFNSITIGVFFIIISFILSQGSYLILTKPLWASRAFNAFGIILAIIFIYTIKTKIYKIELGKILAIFGTYFLIIQANSYANALKAQDEFSKMRIEFMFSDLNRLTPLDNKFQVHIKSGINNAPIVDNSARNFPIINRLVFQRLSPKSYWNANSNFVNLGLKGEYVLSPCNNSENKIIQTLETSMHKITKYDNNCFIVEFHK